VSIGQELDSTTPQRERNWLPLVIASGIVALVLSAVLLIQQHGRQSTQATPISATPDPYSSSLVLTNLKMSESANLAGGKLTYLDGLIANRGASTVTAITAQVLFRSFAHEVAQNETQPLKLIRMREPYIDVEPVSAAPIKPGEQKEFRLIFDAVSPDWDGAYPEVRVLHVTVH